MNALIAHPGAVRGALAATGAVLIQDGAPEAVHDEDEIEIIGRRTEPRFGAEKARKIIEERTVAFEPDEEVLNSNEIAQRLGLRSRQSVHDWLRKGKILGWQTAKRGYQFPVRQFDQRNRPIEGLGEIVALFEYAEVAWDWLTRQPSALKRWEQDGVTVRETGGGTVEITVAGWVDNALEEAICEALPETERQGVAEAVGEYRVRVKGRFSPAERGETLQVPGLAAEIQGELQLADTDLFMESREWSLLDHPVRLTEDELASRDVAHGFEIDVDGKRITHRFVGEEEQLALGVDVEGWSPEALIMWLDGQARQPDIDQGDLVRWLGDPVGHLVTRRGLSISALMRCKFNLARAIRRKIEAIRQQERGRAWQLGLLAPQARPEVSFDCAFTFQDDMYRGERCYRGRWKPARHFLGPDRVPAFDGKEGGEEIQCVQTLDRLPGLKYRVRNVARHPASFWLPLATGRFYPDFVARLDDGRRLVVEYKDAHLASDPTAEQRCIGELRERESGGKGLFIIVEKQVAGKDMRAPLLRKIGTAANASSETHLDP